MFDDLEWHDEAACRGADTALFFPTAGVSLREAKAMCAECPVRQVCLDFAVSHRIPIGVWGGKSPKQRRT